MTNEEYQQLVYDIAYQTILEEFGEEYVNEKKSILTSLLVKGVNKLAKAAQKHNQNVDEYRRRAEEINNTSDPKEKKRLERQQQNMRIKKGINDNSKTCGEHAVHAVKKTGEVVMKGANVLYDKVKQAYQKHQQNNKSKPIGLSSLNKQTT